jgi:alpha-tubulin suppressor-like RCC1 family protein
VQSATAPADPAAPVHVASGDFHTCALRADGTVRCWGRNKEGQLGDGTAEMRTSPVAVAGVRDVSQLALGANSSCALLRDGSVVCWGAGKAWGDGKMRSNVPPTPVAGVRSALRIDAGGLLVCAVLASDKVTCWGNEGDPASAPPDDDAVDVSAAEAHACARLREGRVRCWGDSPWNGAGGLAAPRVGGVTRITTGDAMACAVVASGTVTCWGRNDQGELGREPDNDWHPVPLAVPIEAASDVTAGESHVCATLRAGSTLICWGSNGDGELGRGSQGPPERPAPVAGLRGVSEVALGADHGCARAGGTVWCWGSNAQGQIGDGTLERRTAPVRVAW